MLDVRQLGIEPYILEPAVDPAKTEAKQESPQANMAPDRLLHTFSKLICSHCHGFLVDSILQKIPPEKFLSSLSLPCTVGNLD